MYRFFLQSPSVESPEKSGIERRGWRRWKGVENARSLHSLRFGRDDCRNQALAQACAFCSLISIGPRFQAQTLAGGFGWLCFNPLDKSPLLAHNFYMRIKSENRSASAALLLGTSSGVP